MRQRRLLLYGRSIMTEPALCIMQLKLMQQ